MCPARYANALGFRRGWASSCVQKFSGGDGHTARGSKQPPSPSGLRGLNPRAWPTPSLGISPKIRTKPMNRALAGVRYAAESQSALSSAIRRHMPPAGRLRQHGSGLRVALSIRGKVPGPITGDPAPDYLPLPSLAALARRGASSAGPAASAGLAVGGCGRYSCARRLVPGARTRGWTTRPHVQVPGTEYVDRLPR